MDFRIDNEKTYTNIHFVGIGGVSMSGLAKLVKNKGICVSGSDSKKSKITDELESADIKVFYGHDKKHVCESVDLVVYTAAVHTDNPELVVARERNIDLMERSEFLGRVMKNYKYPICISGTHGKTTVTSLITEIFLHAEKNPTVSVGAFLPSIGGVMRDGGDDYFIAESCEYYDSFLHFNPYIGIILNVEFDHADYFHNLERYRQSFRKFAELIDKKGSLVINTEIPNVMEFVHLLQCQVTTFSFTDAVCCSDWKADNVAYLHDGTCEFDVFRKSGLMGKVKLNISGRHNVQNALAACAAAYQCDISFDTIAEGLSKFKGVNRRFEYKGKATSGAFVYDDYAHHPSEIKTTLHTAKGVVRKDKKLWCVFQPHTHTRTKELLSDFSESFFDTDRIIIIDIYSPSGREEEDCNITSGDLVELIKAKGKDAVWIPSISEAKEFLNKNLCEGDMLITMGAGDVFTLSEAIITTE